MPQSTNQSKTGISVAVSAIIASIWTGLWGFNWAASHLSSWQLYGAILLGLIGGIGLTVFVVERSFKAIDTASDSWERVAKYAIDHEKDPPAFPGDTVSILSRKKP